MPSGVERLKNSNRAPKSMKGIREMVPQQDISGVHPVEYRDDSVRNGFPWLDGRTTSRR